MPAINIVQMALEEMPEAPGPQSSALPDRPTTLPQAVPSEEPVLEAEPAAAGATARTSGHVREPSGTNRPIGRADVTGDPSNSEDVTGTVEESSEEELLLPDVPTKKPSPQKDRREMQESASARREKTGTGIFCAMLAATAFLDLVLEVMPVTLASVLMSYSFFPSEPLLA